MGEREIRRGRGRRGGWRALRGSAGFWAVVAVIVLVLAYAQVLAASRPQVDGDRLRLDSFATLAEQGRVRNAEILDYDSYVVGEYTARDGSTRRYNLPFLKATNTRDRLADLVIDNRIPSSVNQQFAKSLTGPATIVLPALIFIVIFVYFILSWRRGTGLFGAASGARRVKAEDAGVTFADVAGQEQAVAELREVADFLADPRRYASLGAAIPRGVLLYGPPGCGKTLVARALAGEAGAAFYSISGSDFVEIYAGVGAARVRDLFREARATAPSIVFIDEIDAVGRRRQGAGPPRGEGASEERGQALNQLLAEFDGFSPAAGIVVVAATNRPDVLDPALLRPGRFDRSIGLELPDERDRLEILRVHTRSKALEAGIDLDGVARRAVGMSGADIAGLANEAALQAGRAGRPRVSQADLEAAIVRIREAPERRRRLAVRDRSVGSDLLAAERLTFADVAGLDEAIAELGEVRDFLAEPARFEEMGARPPSGYLLSGPPGCGKTLLARAVAGEANAAFVSAAASEFVEVYVGEGAARVRDLFAQARATAPAIVFIDEIDVLGSGRGGGSSDHGERAQTLNQLLVELDGTTRTTGVIAMAATNRPEALDGALTRSGRFDRIVTIDHPDRRARWSILDLHARDKPLAPDVDLEVVARLTQGFVGADLAGVMNEAALLAARARLRQVPMRVVEEAIDRVALGATGSRRLSEEERRVVAYHEAGHGLVALDLPGGRILHKLTIVPRGRSLGSAWLPQADDRHVFPRSLLMEQMAALLGGKVAEEIVFGEPGDGAEPDLARVGAIARSMVAQMGMSDAVGAINWDRVVNGRAQYSEETASLIDVETRRLVREAEGLAHSVLQRRRGDLDRVAEALLERESLSLAEVEAIVAEPARA